MELLKVKKKVNEKLAAFNLLRMQYDKEKQEYNILALKMEAAQEAQSIAQQVAQTIQQKAHTQIAGVVSKCLEIVFEEPYEFKIHFERKRGRTEARLVFERDGLEVDPLTASGGGVVDVASFALRLSCLVLAKPALRRLLIMDEPFKFVSEDFRENIKIMLEKLSKDFGIQIIMVTHIDEIKTGKVVELK